jgi:hypothetical protein
MTDLAAYLPDPAWFAHDPNGVHGVAHAARVLVWAERIADRVAEPAAMRREELRWAAVCHDVERWDDGIDPQHGDCSAVWVLANLLRVRPGLTDGVDLGFVAELCRWHQPSDRDAARLTLELMILKDADGLDRARLGDLDPSRLRLASSLGLVEAAERLCRATGHGGGVDGATVLRAAREMGPIDAAERRSR